MKSQKNCEVTIYRSPDIFILRPEVLSVALGFFWALVLLVITLAAMQFTEFRVITEQLAIIYPGYGLSFLGLLTGVTWAFFSGYLLGLLIGTIYIYFSRRYVNKNGIPVFKIDRCKNVNVIQQGIGDDPYTIVLVANPAILEVENGEKMPDPIMRNHGLFLKTVTRVINSFLSNELMHLPDIFQQMRIITIFDHENSVDIALCEGVSESTSILTARRPLRDSNGDVTENYVYQYVQEQLTAAGLDDPALVDVITIISGNRTYTRSTARFSEDDPERGGKSFSFTFFEPGSTSQEKYHYYYAKQPGMFALSAWDDRLKTPVHEFAHSMSDIDNGAIDDEYIDESHAALRYRINKKFRGGFMVSDGMIEELNGMDIDPEILEIILTGLATIKCEVYREEQKFLRALRIAINNSNVFYDFHELLLKLARFRVVFRIDENSLTKLSTHGLPPEVGNQLQANLDEINRDFTDKKEFLEVLKGILRSPDRGNPDETFDTYKLLILRFANVHNFPIPREFARYTFEGRTKVYESDRYRSDKDLSWVSYAPQRRNENTSCIMDLTYRRYRFDPLIFDFMYDRLLTKMERNHLAPLPCSSFGPNRGVAATASKSGNSSKKSGSATSKSKNRRKK